MNVEVKALARFAAKVRFKPSTGCVIWIGGTASARNGEARIGRFHYEGRTWTARRWAAKFIHGLDIQGGKVAEPGECGDERCVQHVKMGGEPQGHLRMHWLLVRLGYDDTPEEQKEEWARQQREREAGDNDPGDHQPPDWLRPFVDG